MHRLKTCATINFIGASPSLDRGGLFIIYRESTISSQLSAETKDWLGRFILSAQSFFLFTPHPDLLSLKGRGGKRKELLAFAINIRR